VHSFDWTRRILCVGVVDLSITLVWESGTFADRQRYLNNKQQVPATLIGLQGCVALPLDPSHCFYLLTYSVTYQSSGEITAGDLARATAVTAYLSIGTNNS